MKTLWRIFLQNFIITCVIVRQLRFHPINFQSKSHSYFRKFSIFFMCVHVQIEGGLPQLLQRCIVASGIMKTLKESIPFCLHSVLLLIEPSLSNMIMSSDTRGGGTLPFSLRFRKKLPWDLTLSVLTRSFWQSIPYKMNLHKARLHSRIEPGNLFDQQIRLWSTELLRHYKCFFPTFIVYILKDLIFHRT